MTTMLTPHHVQEVAGRQLMRHCAVTGSARRAVTVAEEREVAGGKAKRVEGFMRRCREDAFEVCVLALREGRGGGRRER